MKSSGPMSDVVISCRVRLARNLAKKPFVTRLGPEQAVAISQEIQGAVEASELGSDSHWVAMDDCSPVLRLLLWERNLISRDLAPVEAQQGTNHDSSGRAVLFDRSESVSMMVNEEDHLRIQALAPGFDFNRAWERARDMDQLLESRLEYATDPTLGSRRPA